MRRRTVWRQMIMDVTSHLCRHCWPNRWVLMLCPPPKWWRQRVNSSATQGSGVYVWNICRIFEWLNKNTIFFFFLILQETFDAGLQAFQQEGIANITALKDQLLAAKHIQSKAIEARHASLMKRWNQLLSNSAARKKKLLEAQEHFRKVSG